MQHAKNTTERGYILLMAVLIVSVILAISFGIFALSIKDLILASYLKDSAKAFGAADKGIECALYWDRSTPQNGRAYTIFTTSTQYVAQVGGGSGIANPVCDSVQLDTLPSWTVVNTPDPTTGTTNFSLIFPDNTCADIMVYKEGNSTTTVVSNGYNSCDPNSPRRTQRTIQVEGNF
jgi:hypothetical protein